MARGAEKTPTSENPDTEDIDFAWDEGARPSGAVSESQPAALWRDESSIPEASGVVQRDPPPREPMVTLHDEDPLRYDLVYDRKRDPTRDSMPTIPDIDPLRHDVTEQQDAPSAAPSARAPRRPA
jgi:hypothetical protein